VVVVIWLLVKINLHYRAWLRTATDAEKQAERRAGRSGGAW
jgi:hypothetical protein